MRPIFITIFFGILSYNIAFAQEFTVLKVENIDNKHIDLSLKGKVKSVTIITHDGNYSCDTVKPHFDYSAFKNFPPGACWIVKCNVDTLVYYFDSNLVISKIISTNFLVIEENSGKLEKTEYNFKNGLIQSQNVIINGKIENKNRYKYDSRNNLIQITKSCEKYKSIVIFKYNLFNNLTKEKEFLFSRTSK